MVSIQPEKDLTATDSPAAESLALPFVECLSATAAIESIQAACVATSPAVSFENLIQSPLFCQALVVAAIMSKNLPLAKALVLHHGSFPPPPKDQCAFTMRHSSLTGMSQIETSMWTVLIQAGWALSSGDMCYHAAKSPDPRDGIAFFEAVRASESSGILKSRKKRLLDDALCEGTPEVLRYLSDIFGTSLKLEDDMVIQAIEWRDDGGVDMLKWLLDQGLDVNWIRGASDDAEEIWLDPRERAEAFEANRLRPRSNMKSALHAAADRGNADIVKCLLERGANPNSKDGLGQTAQYIAARDGFPETAAVIEKYENSR